MFTLAISCLNCEFTLIHEPNIPGSYAILLFTTLNFASITNHIHSWVLCLLWVHLFIISGVISPLISSSMLGTYRPGEFVFQCPIFLSFHTVMSNLIKLYSLDVCSLLYVSHTLLKLLKQNKQKASLAVQG